MNERLKRIQERLLAFWGKYNSKQKTIMISITLAVILFVVIMAVALTRPTYVTLITTSSTSESSSVTKILTSAGIQYTSSADGMTISVKEGDLPAANIELGANSIPATGYSLKDALGGGFSATEADKEKQYLAYLEDRITSILDKLSYVNYSKVTLEKPDSTFSVLDSNEETSVSVVLDLKSTPSNEKIQGLANYLATAVGNATTSKITIIDSQTNLLFLGETSDETGLTVTSQNDLYELRMNQVIDNINKLLDKSGYGYSDVNISPFLSINFDKSSTTSTVYDTGTRDQGPYATSNEVTETGSSGNGGVVGTDSNSADVTSYDVTGSNGSTSTYELKQYEYKVNEKNNCYRCSGWCNRLY